MQVRQRFSIIPAMAVTDPRLEPRDLQVLCLLGRHTDDLGWCCRSQVKMARELNCGRATVQRALQRLIEAGYLEHRPKQRESGADAAHDYRVVIDPVAPATCAENAEGGVPTGGQGCPPMDGQGVPTYERAPMLTTPDKRKERGARESEAEEGETADDGAPAEGMRSLERRVKRMADRLRWPGWANSSTSWTVTQFAALSPEERDRAEELGAAYLQHCGKKALSLGMYFRERKFTDLPEEVVKAAKAVAEAPAVAPPYGKMWQAVRLYQLLQPHRQPLPRASAFVEQLMAEDSERGERERLAHRARHGWPMVNDMHTNAENRRGWTVSSALAWLEPLAAGFEPVKVGSERWEAWKAEHMRRGWPWVPDPGRQEWVYFPAGGPEGLSAVEAAINEVQGNDGGEREAAE